MQLKPQDLMLALKFVAALSTREANQDGQPLSPLHIPSIAQSIGLSATEAHEALKRLVAAHLVVASALPGRVQRGRPGRTLLVNRAAVTELVQHGVRYIFVPERGRIVRGMVTGAAAPVLRDIIQAASTPSVWPDPRGETKGESFSPLYRSAVIAARNDARLYALLALVDAIRGGSAREREIAANLFAQEIAGRG
jgi:hypothetical protein